MPSIETAWKDLREHLERRARELADEVRAYPGPIARCDDQLPWLIAQRARAVQIARHADDLEREKETLPESEWLARLALLARNLHLDDDGGKALHGGLVEALRSRTGKRPDGNPRNRPA